MGWTVKRVRAEIDAEEYGDWLHHLNRHPGEYGTQIMLGRIYEMLAQVFSSSERSKPIDMFMIAPWLRPDREKEKLLMAPKKLARKATAFHMGLAASAAQRLKEKNRGG